MNITRMNFLLLFLSHAVASPRFNLSHFIFPTISDEYRPQPSLFLKDVIGAISYSERWKLDEIRVSKLEIEKIRYGNLQRYEIEFRLGNKKVFLFNMRDDVSLWNRFKYSKEGEGDFEVLANQVSSRAVIGSIRIEGPVELLVPGDDSMSLIMPRNTSHAGLKRILVGEDITVEVKNAQSITVLQESDLGNQTDRILVNNWEQCHRWFFPCLICMSVLPVRIHGSASVFAFRTQNPSAEITSNLLSKNVIELLPDTCHAKHTYKKQKYPITSLRPKIRLLEKVLKSFLGDRINRNASRAKLKTKIEASTSFRFQLEIERNIRINDTRLSTMAEWRTRPTVEHVWFEVLARIERKRLKSLSVRKTKSFVGVDSSAWSNLMSNLSFTKLSSVLVAPEALTM